VGNIGEVERANGIFEGSKKVEADNLKGGHDKATIIKEVKAALVPEIKRMIKQNIKQALESESKLSNSLNGQVASDSPQSVLDQIYKEEAALEGVSVNQIKPKVDHFIKAESKHAVKALARQASLKIAKAPAVVTAANAIALALSKVSAKGKLSKVTKVHIEQVKVAAKKQIIETAQKIAQKISEKIHVASKVNGKQAAVQGLKSAQLKIKTATIQAMKEIDDKFVGEKAAKAIEQVAVKKAAIANNQQPVAHKVLRKMETLVPTQKNVIKEIFNLSKDVKVVDPIKVAKSEAKLSAGAPIKGKAAVIQAGKQAVAKLIKKVEQKPSATPVVKSASKKAAKVAAKAEKKAEKKAVKAEKKAEKKAAKAEKKAEKKAAAKAAPKVAAKVAEKKVEKKTAAKVEKKAASKEE
jgi:histone H1/5